MRIRVDVDRCESNGICMAFAPDLFELDNLQILDDTPAESLRGQVSAAVSGCPKAAISVQD